MLLFGEQVVVDAQVRRKQWVARLRKKTVWTRYGLFHHCDLGRDVKIVFDSKIDMQVDSTDAQIRR